MRITGNVFNLLVMVNCAANFILYSALSTKFRSTFSHLFCACSSSTEQSPGRQWHHRRRCCCCSWPVHTYDSAVGREVNLGTGVPGRFAALRHSGRGSTTAGAEGGAGGPVLSTVAEDTIREEDDGLCSPLTHTTTVERLMMSSQSAVEDLDDCHITQL